MGTYLIDLSDKFLLIEETIPLFDIFETEMPFRYLNVHRFFIFLRKSKKKRSLRVNIDAKVRT